ncbi:DUF2157 domain-containing protein [Rhodoflexus sp.]
MKPLWSKLQHAPRFKEEIDTWVAEGIIGESQAQELIRRYELDVPPPWYMQSGWLLRGIGLLVVAAGILLLIAENWQHFPVPVQMAVGLLPLAASYAVAWREQSLGRMRQAELAMLFGSLLLGVNIWLQAQIFHISAYYPDGILWWIIGALPVIFWFQNKILHFFFTVLACVWLGVQFEYEQFSLWAALIVGLLFYMEYLKPNGWTLVACIALGLWFFLGLLIYEARHFKQNSWGEPHVAAIFTAAFPMLFLLVFQRIKSRYGERAAWLLESAAMIFMAGFFFLLTFESSLKDLVRSSAGASLPFTIWGLIAAVLILSAFIAPKNKALPPYVAAFVLALAPCLIPMLTLTENEGQTTSADAYMLLMNIGFVLFAVAHILMAIAVTKQKGTFMSGIFYLMVWLLGRYLALVEDYVTTAIIFIAFGASIYYLSSWWDKRLNAAASETNP